MYLLGQLSLTRCPHCGIDSPLLLQRASFETENYDNTKKQTWAAYACRRCGGGILASAYQANGLVQDYFPSVRVVDDTVPAVPKEYLLQALNSRHAPAGAVMLAASSIDAMLKEKGYSDGSLYSRIDKAVSDHLITGEMGEWAHEIRLEANGQRHADGQFSLPSVEDAERVIEFAEALAQFLFVLPARVSRGRAARS